MFAYICTLITLYCVLILWCAQDTRAECPPITSRKEWDAAKSQHHLYLDTPVQLVVIQHTVTQACSDDVSCAEVLRNLQKIHTEKSFLWDIGPSFLVGGNGKLYEGRGWNHVAMHTPGYNNRSIGIAFIGNFNNQEPSPKALDAVKAFLGCGVAEDKLTTNVKVVVHSQLLSTESPGKHLAKKIMSWPEWTNDISNIKKLADGLEEEITDSLKQIESKPNTDLVLTNPKQIDLLSNLRDVVADLLNNLSILANGTADTANSLFIDLNKQNNLFIEKLVLDLKKFKDQVGTSFGIIPGIPGVQNCANSLVEKANTLYNTIETKAKECGVERVKEIDEMIKELSTMSSNAIDYTKSATENTRNCTELNYGIELKTKACLNSVNQETDDIFKTYVTLRTSMLESIDKHMADLPSTLDSCAKHLTNAQKETEKIVSDITQCTTSTSGYNGLGL